MKKAVTIILLAMAALVLIYGLMEANKLNIADAERVGILGCISVLSSAFITIAIAINWFNKKA